jgi:hypothetical protein
VVTRAAHDDDVQVNLPLDHLLGAHITIVFLSLMLAA